jgi:hypothetical protein
MDAFKKEINYRLVHLKISLKNKINNPNIMT